MADMFPTITREIPAQAGTEIGRSPAFDSESNRFLLTDGALRERSGVEAVRQWFDLALRQRPGGVAIYPDSEERQYGVPRDLVGRKLPDGLLAAELERSVRETASYCPAVREINSFRVSRRGRALIVEFTAVLYTSESLEVSVNV